MSLSGHTTWDRTKKLQPGKKKNYETLDLTLDFGLHSQLDRAATNLMPVCTGLQLIGRITVKNEYSSEASPATSLS
jgi:hypothetical protein